MFEKDKYGYPIENCSVVITLKDNQIIKGKYDPAIGFMTADGRMIWKENVLSYEIIAESKITGATIFDKEAEEIAKDIYIHHFDDDVNYPEVLKAITVGVQKGAELRKKENAELKKKNKELDEFLCVGSAFNKTLNSTNKALEEERDRYRNMTFNQKEQLVQAKEIIKEYYDLVEIMLLHNKIDTEKSVKLEVKAEQFLKEK